MRMYGRSALLTAVLTGTLAAVAPPATAATWTGETHGKVLRSSRLVSGGFTWTGTFFFRTNRRGDVRGEAVVAYEPEIDPAGLNNAVGYIRDIGATAIQVAGPFAGFLGQAAIGNIVGTTVNFKSAMAIRRGRLRGRLADDRLTLRWRGQVPGVPYDVQLVLANRTETISSDVAELQSPFESTATVSGGRFAVKATEETSGAEGVEQLVGSYWSAHRLR